MSRCKRSICIPCNVPSETWKNICVLCPWLFCTLCTLDCVGFLQAKTSEDLRQEVALQLFYRAHKHTNIQTNRLQKPIIEDFRNMMALAVSGKQVPAVCLADVCLADVCLADVCLADVCLADVCLSVSLFACLCMCAHIHTYIHTCIQVPPFHLAIDKVFPAPTASRGKAESSAGTSSCVVKRDADAGPADACGTVHLLLGDPCHLRRRNLFSNCCFEFILKAIPL